jgi:predicted nuclease with RNAse H fold
MPKNAAVYEVFPSASYNLLNRAGGVRVSIDFVNFARGPKDMLDACVAAMTVREFVEGRGFEIGGGDRLGSIVLPRRPEIGSKSRVLEWPSSTTLETA